MRWVPEIVSPVWVTIGNKKVGHMGARLARAAGPKATAGGDAPVPAAPAGTLDPPVMLMAAAGMRANSAADLLPDDHGADARGRRRQGRVHAGALLGGDAPRRSPTAS